MPRYRRHCGWVALPALVLLLIVSHEGAGLWRQLTSHQVDAALDIAAGPPPQAPTTTNNQSTDTHSLSTITTPSTHTDTRLHLNSHIQHMSRKGHYQQMLTLHSDFLINQPNLCPSDTRIDYVLVVHTSTGHFDRRKAIRDTFGNQTAFKNVTQRVVFLVGLPSIRIYIDTSYRIQQEAAEYGDIVQGPFVDSYHNLTHKAVMGLRWVADHCSHAQYVVKIDDDVFINVHRLIRGIFPLLVNKTRTIACRVVVKGAGLIYRTGKWGIGDRHFTNRRTYPFDMCNGYFAVMTSDLIQPMLDAVEVTPFLWIDDVYVYGMLADAIGGVTHMGDHRRTKSIDYARECFSKEGFRCIITVLNDNLVEVSDVYTMWTSALHTATYDDGLLIV